MPGLWRSQDLGLRGTMGRADRCCAAERLCPADARLTVALEGGILRQIGTARVAVMWSDGTDGIPHTYTQPLGGKRKEFFTD